MMGAYNGYGLGWPGIHDPVLGFFPLANGWHRCRLRVAGAGRLPGPRKAGQ